MSKVSIESVSLSYHSLKGETEALNNITFTVEEREFFTIVGPSGCGKSTLLNIVAGLLTPSSGKVLVDGEEIEQGSSKLGYMFQRDHLFEWLSVWDNVCLGLKIQRRMTAHNQSRIETLLKNYHLWDFKDHRPNELSGGMRQRVALIRTLALAPEVLLLDEPFSALDYQTRLMVSDEVFSIIKQEHKTAIMVTHDISEAISMSSSILILSKRPASIKEIVNLSFPDSYSSPLRRRDHPDFKNYFNHIWKELEYDDTGK